MSKRYLLSELYGRIGQILQEYGDMEIGREKIWGIDQFNTHSLNIINLHRNAFHPFIITNKEGKVIYKKFIINILQTLD
jgi:hypothetical protein